MEVGDRRIIQYESFNPGPDKLEDLRCFVRAVVHLLDPLRLVTFFADNALARPFPAGLVSLVPSEKLRRNSPFPAPEYPYILAKLVPLRNSPKG